MARKKDPLHGIPESIRETVRDAMRTLAESGSLEQALKKMAAESRKDDGWRGGVETLLICRYHNLKAEAASLKLALELLGVNFDA